MPFEIALPLDRVSEWRPGVKEDTCLLSQGAPTKTTSLFQVFGALKLVSSALLS